MQNAQGKGSRSVRVQNVQNTSGRVSTAELVEFVQEQAARRPIKEVARLTGLSEKAVANLRLGLAGASAQTISTWCRNDPHFRALYFGFCGGELETDPAFYAHMAQAITAYQRSKDAA